MLLHFILIFWYFFLIWKTFMFRFGLIRKLASIFPILYLAPVNFLAFTFERALRFVSHPHFKLTPSLCLTVHAPGQNKRLKRDRVQCRLSLRVFLHRSVLRKDDFLGVRVRLVNQKRNSNRPPQLLQTRKVAPKRLINTSL